MTRSPRAGRIVFGCLMLAVGLATAQPVLLVEDGVAEADYDTYVLVGQVRRALHRAGLEFDLVRDAALPGVPPAAHKLIVLPANPTLSPAAADWLRLAVSKGGRLLVFPPAPAAIAGLVGIDTIGRMQELSDPVVTGMALDREKVRALPARWRQNDWRCQSITPNAGARIVGTWVTAQPPWSSAPALVLTGHGAFLAATLQGDDRLGEAQVLLALATHYFPGLWHSTLPRILAAVGKVGDSASLADLKQMLQDQPPAATRLGLAWDACRSAGDKVHKAQELYATALRQGKRTNPKGKPPLVTSTPTQRYLPVAQLGWEAQVAAEQAYYIGQGGRPGEFRGVWLQNAGGLRHWGWEHTVTAIKENNFSALFVNVLNGGYANYPSEILPHVTAEGDDPLAEAARWCRQLGIECHVWIMCNYLRPLTPKDWRDRLEAEGRLQMNKAGQVLGWLRPTDERNRQMMAAAAAEIARRYDVDGIHLDYIRYAGNDADYSPAEREAFSIAMGETIEGWPQSVGIGGAWRTRWAAWRRQQVDAEVQAVAGAVREVKPDIQVSAAVSPIWVDSSYTVGQDPAGWAHQGWVDFLCPMNYQTRDSTFYRYLMVQQRDVGDGVHLYPGIAAWRHESPGDTIAQVRKLRSMNIPGFVLFHLDRRLALEWLPALRLGVTSSGPALGPPVPVSGDVPSFGG